jgi:hypothetical protein
MLLLRMWVRQFRLKGPTGRFIATLLTRVVNLRIADFTSKWITLYFAVFRDLCGRCMPKIPLVRIRAGCKGYSGATTFALTPRLREPITRDLHCLSRHPIAGPECPESAEGRSNGCTHG